MTEGMKLTDRRRSNGGFEYDDIGEKTEDPPSQRIQGLCRASCFDLIQDELIWVQVKLYGPKMDLDSEAIEVNMKMDSLEGLEIDGVCRNLKIRSLETIGLG
ncbi:unnamed protein product [Vicia faba]|uniref:Uncharacterized protein n=1 Tax=Vicia faba TaxID=3906 RepID=A0AAV1BCP1_VICFA|nr:unnamed protein product [Vicia faba]